MFNIISINSKKLNGAKSKESTFPTGNEVPSCIVTPKSDPADIIWYSLAFSQKLNDFLLFLTFY